MPAQELPIYFLTVHGLCSYCLLAFKMSVFCLPSHSLSAYCLSTHGVFAFALPLLCLCFAFALPAFSLPVYCLPDLRAAYSLAVCLLSACSCAICLEYCQRAHWLFCPLSVCLSTCSVHGLSAYSLSTYVLPVYGLPTQELYSMSTVCLPKGGLSLGSLPMAV